MISIEKRGNGSFSASLNISPVTNTPKLEWFLYAKFGLDSNIKEEYHDFFSIIVDYIPINLGKNLTWHDIVGVNVTDREFNSTIYVNAVHHQPNCTKVNFISRNKDVFIVEIEMIFDPETASEILMNNENSLRLRCELKFAGIHMSQYALDDKDSFNDRDYLVSFLENYISYKHLLGPYYPFPPPEPYSGLSSVEFEPKID